MSLKLIFFGTPDFAVYSLKEIYKSHFTVKCVVTNPDKKSGRGRKINTSPVKNFCIENNIKTLQPESFTDSQFISKLKLFKADLFVVVAFKKLPKLVWAIPPLGTINLHASILPDFRGAAPINWVIINQQNKTGITTFFINDKIDSGKIILTEKIKINKLETFDTLEKKMILLSKKIIISTLHEVKKGNCGYSQVEKKNLNLAPKLNRENTRLNWSYPLDKIDAKIRGLSSNPGAWTNFIGKEGKMIVKIYSASVKLSKNHSNSENLLVLKDEIIITHKDGVLICHEIQIPNKKRMKSKEILNGKHLKSFFRVK
tara:strand:- start:445 stop:1386 length:942 start_codon:yes stop_codon:yes gene_type:complete